jgi:hypothetical protein
VVLEISKLDEVDSKERKVGHKGEFGEDVVSRRIG